SLLASGSSDGSIMLWDVMRGAKVLTIIPGRSGSVALLPDGRYRAIGRPAGTVWHAIGLCRFELGELEPYIARRVTDDEPLVQLGGTSRPGLLRASASSSAVGSTDS